MTNDVKKEQFRDSIINMLREKYRDAVGNIIEIFKKENVDIEKLITILRFDDPKSVFSTDDVFSTITTDIFTLFNHVNKYCNSIYDYQVLDDLVKTSKCTEAIKELDAFTKLRKDSILKEIDLISEHGELLNPDDLMPGTYKFIIEYVGGKCTIHTKEMIQDVVEQSVRLKKGVIIFKGCDQGSILFVYQISGVVKNYLLQYKFTEEDLTYLERNNITSLIVDDIRIMNSSQVTVANYNITLEIEYNLLSSYEYNFCSYINIRGLYYSLQITDKQF